MATGKYVPPSKRPGYVPPATSTLPPSSRPYRPRQASASDLPTYSPLILNNVFTHAQDGTITFFSYPAPFHHRQPPLPYDPTRTPLDTPLPPSPPLPAPIHPLSNLISYISVFPRAQPAWDSRGELWTHSSADKLIDDGKGEKRNFNRPIPVFVPAPGNLREFIFGGWWLVDQLDVIPAQSDTLKEFLVHKERANGYRPGGRTADAWLQSLSQTWIKLHLVQAPPTSSHYPNLKDPMSVNEPDGEIERYMLEIGGLTNELDIFKQTQEERDMALEQAKMI